MTEEPKLQNALEVLMGLLDSNVERLLAITRVDQLVTPAIEEAISSLDQPSVDEREQAIIDARQALRKAMLNWLEAKDIGARE